MLFAWIQRRSSLTNRQENVDHRDIYAFEGKAKQLQKYQEKCFPVCRSFKEQIGENICKARGL